MSSEESDIEQTIREAHILIVDDIEANIEVLTDALEDDGYKNVVSTTDSKRGLAMLSTAPYDLVLLDMRMPGMDGHEFLERMRERFTGRHLPVLVLTAQTDEQTRRRALAAGVRDFVTKPFMLWELLSRVRNTLELEVLYRRSKLANVELESRVRARTWELEDTRKEIIRRLATAGEFRDHETGQHVVRMSHFAHHLARAAGLAQETAEMIRDAAPLHDIGKIGIPDAILLKPGKLDPQEWEIMKRHAPIGGQILAGSGAPLLEMARRIALTHHEQWSGGGYPEGLAGEDIPLEGRIVTVADVFDALTSARPYKPSWTIERAVEYITEGAGTRLDPALVALFNRELPALLEIRERFRDEEGHSPGAQPYLFRMLQSLGHVS